MSSEFEDMYVKRVYNEIAEDFSRTRYSYWEYVHKFILSLTPNSKMLDLGCGNGKYLSVRKDLDLYASDNCENLIEIVKRKYPTIKTFISDVTNTKFETNKFDSVISIAVIHHLATTERRIEMLKEIIRILKVGAQCLVTAWATEQTNTKTLSKATKISDTNDWLISWEDKKNNKISQRFYHLFEKGEFEDLLSNFPNIKIIDSAYEKDNWNVIFIKLP